MDMKTLTINDTTIMVNRETIARLTNATEPAQEPEGFVESFSWHLTRFTSIISLKTVLSGDNNSSNGCF